MQERIRRRMATGMAPALAALLALCSALGVMAQTGSRAASPPPVNVEVVDGRTVVLVASVRTGSGQMSLSWNLLTPGYRFTNDSIRFGAAASYFSCTTYNNGQIVRCTRYADAPSGRFEYSVVVSSGGSATAPSDPNIWINSD